MSDAPPERNSNSQSNLIEVQHVGVTAKLQSPLKNLFMSYSSSTDSENNQMLYKNTCNSNSKYNKFLNEATQDTDASVTESSKVLYEMKSMSAEIKKKSSHTLTPSKIEFELYTKPKKRLQRHKDSNRTSQKKKATKRQLFIKETVNSSHVKKTSILKRLKHSLTKIKNSKQESKPTVDKLFEDLPEPPAPAKDVHIGIYTFDHGCAEYLRTHDCPPEILSLVLAEKATHYATRFWAEVFGSLQIAVAFVVTFLLQCYRFILYSLVNTLLVGFLHMTSDYLLKPLLTVIFNGFLQPPMIFCFNVLSSMRDILEPIADTLNNFMKPVATVGRSVRLIHATYNKKNISKTV